MRAINTLTALALCLIFYSVASSQNCSNLNFQLQGEYPSVCGKITMTMIHDQDSAPYLYVANKTDGLVVLDISDPANPTVAAQLDTGHFLGLDVMNLSQNPGEDFILLALGNHFTNPQEGGMAIVDVSDPTSPSATDVYVHPGSGSGGGIVISEDDYAYFGAMKSGLIILDISDPGDIQYVSDFMPDINYPKVNPNADLYNVRGMVLDNDILYTCFDAGGLRIINVSDKANPVETGRYSNPALHDPINLPRAYNNIVLRDSLVYVAVDYCGLEVLNISDTANITLHGWWNPYGCPNNNWFTSPVHTNELYFNESCDQLFVSTGESDMVVVDVSDPANPDSCNFYGGTNNSIGTWGVSGYSNQIYLSYICSFIPFSSNWTGVKILSYSECQGIGSDEIRMGNFKILFPNPATQTLRLPAEGTYQILNAQGQMGSSGSSVGNEVDISRLPKGIYWLHQAGSNYKFVKQ